MQQFLLKRNIFFSRRRNEIMQQFCASFGEGYISIACSPFTGFTVCCYDHLGFLCGPANCSTYVTALLKRTNRPPYIDIDWQRLYGLKHYLLFENHLTRHQSDLKRKIKSLNLNLIEFFFKKEIHDRVSLISLPNVSFLVWLVTLGYLHRVVKYASFRDTGQDEHSSV